MNFYDKNPYLFLNNLRNDVEFPSPFLISLIMASKFNGEVYTNGGDFVTKIKGRFYDYQSEVDASEVEDYIKFDTLSLLTISKLYDKIKWFFIASLDDYDEELLN